MGLDNIEGKNDQDELQRLSDKILFRINRKKCECLCVFVCVCVCVCVCVDVTYTKALS